MITERAALIVIDVQVDFCPGGALAVPDGDAVVSACNARMASHDLIVLTQDWHPAGHRSFASSHPGHAPFQAIELDYGPQVLWPDHCVQGTPGATFHPALELDRARLVIRKGTNPAIDSYSAFFENDRRTPTGLDGALRDLGVRSLELVGLATDFCVRYTALDARRLGFDVRVVERACRAIDLAGSLTTTWRELAEAGVQRA